MQRFLDEVEPFVDEAEDGPSPWALGDTDNDDVSELFERWDGDDELTDDWLDEHVAGLNGAADHAKEATVDDPEPGGGGVALRRPAPRRVRRRRADWEAAADLPAPNVPGYVRDRRGTWRYSATGQVVPGGRDLTLRSLYGFPAGGGHVSVPVELVRSEAELQWCLRWKATLTTRLHGRRSVTVLRVPEGEWERRADIPFGLWAPELTAGRLLGIGQVAQLAGVSPATITAYLSRWRMPDPVVRIGHTPLWSRPVIRQWLAGRPGQGRRKPG